MLIAALKQRRILQLGIVLFAWFSTASVHSQVDSNDGFPPTVRTESNMQWKVSGKVTGPNSIPIPRAKVYLSRGCVYRPIGTTGGRSYRDFSEPVKIGVGGEYEIDVRENYRLLFVTPGFSPANVAVPDGSGLDIQLDRGRTIAGTILLPSGEPAVGVKVSPVQWLVPKPQSEIDKIAKDQVRFYRRGALKNYIAGFTDFGESRAAITDNEGHFSIAQLPDKFRVGLAAKIPGGKEQIIYVRSKEDSGNLDFESQILEENEFTYQTSSCAVLQVIATDAATGQPASVAKIGIQPITGSGGAEYLRYTESFSSPTAAMNMIAYPKGSTALVIPKDHVTLLCSQFELPPNQEREVIEKEVAFNRGKPIRGKVISADTGEPIKGVRIRWRTFPEMKEVDKNGNFPRMDIETDRDGIFEMAVPDIDCVIGVMGRVPGFSSVTNWNEQALYEKIAPDLLDVFTRRLRSGDLDDVELELRLPPCFRLDVNVVRDGHPVPNCIVKGQNREYSDWESNGWRNDSSFSKVADEQGHVVIDQWYDNSFQLAMARYEAALDPDNSSQHHEFTESPYPSTLQAFTDDGFNQGVIKVPLPDIVPDSYVIPLTIELMNPPSVLGRIVDTDGEGIGGLEVTASLGGSIFRASQIWKTKTKPDGWFKMAGLSFGEINWSLDRSRVVTKGGSRGKIQIDTTELQNSSLLKVPPVVCVNVTELSKELSSLDLDSLNNKDASVALKTYIQDYIDKVPDGPREYFSSYGGDDAVPSFMKRLRAKALVKLEKLADREPGSDFELQLATTAPTFFGTRKSHIARTQGDEIDQWCAKRLLENHIQNPDAQEKLIDVVSRTTFSRMGWMGARREMHQQWNTLLQSSQFKKTRAAAASELVLIQSQAMRDLCKQIHDRKSFDDGLTQLKKYLDSAQGNSDLVPAKLRERGMPWLENSLKTVENVIKPSNPRSNNAPGSSYSFGSRISPGANDPNKMIESRAQAVYDLLHPYVESLRD